MTSPSALVGALAAWRLTRAVTTDQISEPLRIAVHKRWPDSMLAYYVDCPYCISVAAGLLVASGLVPKRVVRGLALSGAICVAVDLAATTREWMAER